MNLTDLPALNAILNSSSFIFLLLGFRAIKRGERTLHKKMMLTACCTSLLFICSYLVYHYNVGSVKFQGEGWNRYFYFTILLSHTILAAVVAPMALLTLYRGLKGNYEAHKRISKKTFYIWSYVSVTGVVVYFMLYHIFR